MDVCLMWAGLVAMDGMGKWGGAWCACCCNDELQFVATPTPACYSRKAMFEPLAEPNAFARGFYLIGGL